MTFRKRAVLLPIAAVVLLTAGAGLLFPSGIQALSTLFLNITPMRGFTNGDCLNVTAGKLGQQACSGGGGSIPNTTNALVGDGAGNALAATGTGSNCVHVDGSSASCPGGGGSSTPVTVLHSLSLRSSGTAGPLALTGYSAGNIVVIFLDSEGTTASEPTISWSDGTTQTLAASGLIGGAPRNATTYVATLASAAPTVTTAWPGGASFSGILAVEFPVSLATATVDTTGSVGSCCQTGNPISTVVLSTTVSDIVISSVGMNSSSDYAICGANMMTAGRSLGNDASYMCFGVAPVAVTGLPVAFPFITTGTNGMQAVAIKHQ